MTATDWNKGTEYAKSGKFSDAGEAWDAYLDTEEAFHTQSYHPADLIRAQRNFIHAYQVAANA